tara:strand:- start:862 stop:1041 length:180 start_codon:yes stop_codon:yes gene_type:complete
MIDTDKYDFEKALKFVEFTIWNSIVEHEKAEAPASVIAELKDAHDYIVKVMDIVNKEDD